MNKTNYNDIKLNDLRFLVHLSIVFAIPVTYILLKLGLWYAIGVSMFGYFILGRVM